MRIESHARVHNTFGIDAKARWMAEYDTLEELIEIIDRFRDEPLLHIGSGSNLLFVNDYDGVVLHSRIASIEVVSEVGDEVVIRVGASTIWDKLVEDTLKRGWYNLENLSLIPGEVGATAIQNIGAYGAEVAETIVNVECMNLRTAEKRTFLNKECNYGYRHSIFKEDDFRGQWAVLYVTYRLSKTFRPRLDYGGIRAELEHSGIEIDSVTPEQLRQTIIGIRQSKLPDPQVEGNAGSFFMNPIVPRDKYESLALQYPNMPHYDVADNQVKIPAGWMIEQCGWKGRALGKAAVHSRQALVLVNKGGATGSDVVRLCDAIRRDVNNKFTIDIKPEVNFVG